ncbi:MAG: glycosyltransferase family 2 protein [Candidatus Hydrogenedentes bacterium]|nr:glycosyltransferase family 2 protein [Candidatus Hydrogenedentota bacterium]
MKIYSKKGLVFNRNKYNEVISLEDLKKWFRVFRDIFHHRKVEFFTDIDENLETTCNLFSFAKEILDLPVYFSTNFKYPPLNLNLLKEFEVLGIVLCINQSNNYSLDEWESATSELSLPLLLNIPIETEILRLLCEKYLDTLSKVKAITFMLKHPLFGSSGKSRELSIPKDLMSEIIATLSKNGVVINLLGLPFCLVDPSLYSNILNTYQYPYDPLSFEPCALEFSKTLYNLKSHKIRKLLEIRLKEKTSFHSGIDFLLIPWILHHPVLYTPIWALHKLTRHLRKKNLPRPLPENLTEIEYLLKKYKEKSEKSYGPLCVSCALKYICDRGENPFFNLDFSPQPIKGNPIKDPMHFRSKIDSYIDRVEKNLIEYYSCLPQLKQKTLKIISATKPWKEIQPEDYEIENRTTHYMPGGVRWFSFNTGELVSTILCRTNPPLTISATFGGGFAELIGFSFGPYSKIVCPMIAPSHTLTLHIERSGEYVLLRDNELVHPTEFKHHHLLPEHLPSVLEPRISIWNIDGEIVTQGITLWKSEPHLKNLTANEKKISILYVCSRYAQRLRVSLLSVAHQKNIDLSDIEILVAYIPGFDATEDILDCFETTFPNIKIIRSPFSKNMWKSKGTLINASLPYCSGGWIVLLDADIILHPEFLSKLLQVPENKVFAAPDGRKMLTPQTTAKILLDQIRPWECYKELFDGPGEYRQREAQGIPIGYCQCCRKNIFSEILYPEFQHFEGADWFFGRSVVEKFGPEYRLEGIALLHLDHGGSQWYGSNKHR